jgi:hypothetical protein
MAFGGIPAKTKTSPINPITGMPLDAPVAGGPGPYELYNQGVSGDANIRDTVMEGYKKILDANDPSSSNYVGNKPYNVTNANYAVSPYFTQAYGNLANLTQTGGITPQEQADLRERGISPIRAVYGNAQREAARGQVLSGGYSPNAGAIRAKMAREMSDRLSGAVTNVNADIAGRVQQGRLTSSGQLGTLGAGENEIRNRFALENAQAANQAAQFGATQASVGRDRDLRALEGMRSLYGTTPAQAQLFGNQALQGSTLQANIMENNNRTGLQAIAQGMAPTQRFGTPPLNRAPISPQNRSVAPPIYMPGITRPFPSYA